MTINMMKPADELADDRVTLDDDDDDAELSVPRWQLTSVKWVMGEGDKNGNMI